MNAARQHLIHLLEHTTPTNLAQWTGIPLWTILATIDQLEGDMPADLRQHILTTRTPDERCPLLGAALHLLGRRNTITGPEAALALNTTTRKLCSTLNRCGYHGAADHLTTPHRRAA